ncbi:MAG: hypothetical protein P1U53_16840 [Sulfitobacter sp.]|nr:hypothetical protein [Sulfitobacter sp.]
MLFLPGCQSGFEVPPAWNLGGQTAAYHQGPLVAAGETGPRRFVMPLLKWLSEDLPAGSLEDLTVLGWQTLPMPEGDRAWILGGGAGNLPAPVLLRATSGGVAAQTLLEGARSYGAAMADKSIPSPGRPIIVCLDGNGDAGRTQPGDVPVLAELELVDPVAGPSRLWRSVDPGVGGDTGPGNGLNLVMRLALVDVGMVCRPWKSEEVPADYGATPGPSIRLAIGNSGVELSRTDQPHVSEAQRTGLALWSAGAALAGARGTDLDRYLDSILLEARLRHYESGQGGEPDGEWQEWLKGARHWLRNVAYGLPMQAN